MPSWFGEYNLASSVTSNYEGHKELEDLLRNACFSDKFSDMKIRLRNGEEIHCHRLILCGQCQFFDNALKADRFEEGHTGVIDMPNDHPHAVKALLEFCYKRSYTVNPDLDICDKLLFHIDVMSVAAVYNMRSLENKASGWIYSRLKTNWENVIPVIPDVLRIFEQLSSLTRSEWSPHMLNALCDGALDHSDLLLETETWEGLWEHSGEFMSEMTRTMKARWTLQEGDFKKARSWLKKLLGKDALRVVECPHNWCPVIKRGLILPEESPWICNRCHSEVKSIDWLSSWDTAATSALYWD